MLRVTRQQVIAFRAAALHLQRRLPAGALAEAIRPVGLQDTPPGNAALGAAARVEGLTPEAWARALDPDKTLVELWAMRGSPFVVPAGDLPVFTLGLLPEGEAATLHLITSGLWPVVERAGVSAQALVERLAERLLEVLDGRVVGKRDLGRALGPAVPEPLRRQFADEASLSVLTLTVARIIAHHGLYLIAPRAGDQVSLVRTDQWLGQAPDPSTAEQARAEVVRRFLRAFGPATARDMAWWMAALPDAATRGVLAAHAERLWQQVAGELAEVELERGRRGFVLQADLPRLEAPPALDEVRLLPPYDPFLMLHDRETLLPPAQQRRVWRAVNNPGVVLAGADLVAAWTARSRQGRLIVAVEPLDALLAPATRDAVRAEAERLAPLRGCSAVEVEFREP